MVPTGTCALLEREGRLEKLDPAIVADPGVPKELKSDHCMSQIVYSVAIGWRKKPFGDKQPRGWDAFWNVKDFPGGRSMGRVGYRPGGGQPYRFQGFAPVLSFIYDP